MPETGKATETARHKKETVPELEYLMRRYGDQVVRLAFSYLHDVEDARDTAQEVFLRVYRFLPRFRGKSVPYTWIYRVTVNLCRDRLRKKYRYQWQLYDDLELPAGFNTESQVLSGLEQEALFAAVMNLPAEFREVIILYYLNQCDVKEIAEITGISKALVKTRLFRARQKLKALLLESGVVDSAEENM
ncbi:MAG TPA: sigma-70 family RNA polymerase sigma factor [Firmicutes bacterium]|nr:sigma-70 family RNA polymerase sigma factor [Bacillota bacterium]